MKVGDKVIVNPNISDGAWSKHGYGFHSSSMLIPGVFTIQREYLSGGFFIGVEDKVYDEEWLLPVPLYNIGDTVKIRENLNTSDMVPYSVSPYMIKHAGQTLEVLSVEVGKRNKDLVVGDDGCLYRLQEDKSSWSWSSPMFDLTYKCKNCKSYESRLQKQESPFGGSSRVNPGAICCRKHKPRVTVQSVSFQEVLGRG